MANTNYPFGVSSYGMPIVPTAYGKVYGVGGAGNVTGSNTGSTITPGPGSNVYFVNSSMSTASDAKISNGLSPLRPYKSINFAVAQCLANNNDVIFVGPGHVETVAAAAGLAFGVAGVTVIGMGNATDKATVNLTATASTVTVTAANVTLVNLLFTTGIDAVATAITPTAADFTMQDCEFRDAPSKATTIQIITTAACSRFRLINYKYVTSTTGTAKTEAVRIVGGADHELINVRIRGAFSTAVINNVTTLCSNVMVVNCNLNNVSAVVAVAQLTTSSLNFLGTMLGSATANGAGSAITAASTLDTADMATSICSAGVNIQFTVGD